MSVTYTATLPVGEHSVLFLSGLLHAERRRLGTRAGTRSLGCFKQAVLVLRWLLDGTRVTQLATDNAISRSTGYTYLHEGLTVLAAHAPGLNSVLLAAKMAGYAHVTIDGTLIETDRCRTPGPTPGVDLRLLGDLGYEGEADTITVAFKKPKNAACTDVQQQFNRAHNAVRAIGERGNSLLKTTFKALRNVSLCPWTIGRITAAALVILHIEHGRTT